MLLSTSLILYIIDVIEKTTNNLNINMMLEFIRIVNFENFNIKVITISLKEDYDI